MGAVASLVVLAVGASFACGRADTARGAVGAAAASEDAGLESGGPVAAGAPDAAAPLDCPPTRVISDVSDDPSATASGAAVNVMSAYCGACHVPGAAEPARSGPADATDFNGMIDEGFVVDCDAERSPIIISMRANEMPPPDYFGISATPSDIDVVVTFIEFDCSDLEKACAESPSEPGCDEVIAARRARRCAW